MKKSGIGCHDPGFDADDNRVDHVLPAVVHQLCPPHLPAHIKKMIGQQHRLHERD